MTVLVNGVEIVRGAIRLPRVGVWHADVELDATKLLEGPAAITTDDGSFSLAGKVLRQGIFEGRKLSARLIGGAGGLSKTLPPIAYDRVTLELVLKDILRACGERLSTTSDRAVLSASLAKWIRIAGTGGTALAQLLHPIATSWRVLADGSLWVGTDTYPAAAKTPFEVLDRSYTDAKLELASYRPFVLPGTTLTVAGSAATTRERVSYVVHTIDGGETRSEVWLES